MAFVPPTLADVRAAAARIAAYATVTPVLRNDVLNASAGASLHFKCEHLQRGGAQRQSRQRESQARVHAPTLG